MASPNGVYSMNFNLDKSPVQLYGVQYCYLFHSEGNGAAFPIHGTVHVGYLANNHGRGNHNEEGVVIFDKTGSESEVEIYAVDDQDQETQLLTT